MGMWMARRRPKASWGQLNMCISNFSMSWLNVYRKEGLETADIMMTWANERERTQHSRLTLPLGLYPGYKRPAHALNKGVGFCFSPGSWSLYHWFQAFSFPSTRGYPFRLVPCNGYVCDLLQHKPPLGTHIMRCYSEGQSLLNLC